MPTNTDDLAAAGRPDTTFRDRGGDVHIRAAAQMREYEAIVDRIAASGARTVLDWGCGWGQMSHLLTQRGLKVTSLEYVAAGASDARAAQRFPDVEVTFTNDPVTLPYSKASFDAVLSLGVLEHVRDPEASLGELCRVLRPGGTLWVYKLSNRRSYLEWIARRLGLYYHGHFPDDRLYTTETARELLTNQGFETHRLRYANMLPLTLTGPVATALGAVIWNVSCALSRVPLLRLVATNVELVATKRDGTDQAD